MTTYIIYWLTKIIQWLQPIATGEDKVTAAVRQAYVTVGLDSATFAPHVNLTKTGKLYDILHMAADILNVDHNLTTVGDVINHLKG